MSSENGVRDQVVFALYALTVVAWIYLVINRGNDNLVAFFAPPVAAHVGVGLLLPARRILLLALAPMVLALPAGKEPGLDVEMPIAFNLFVMSPLFGALIGVGVLIRRWRSETRK